MEPGKFYLFACPWDWTFVGEFVRYDERNEHIIIRNGGYFTRTGATFDALSESGFVADTKFHARKDGAEQGIAIPNAWWSWTAPTPWVKGRR